VALFIDLFGFLSILLRAVTIGSQSLAMGGIVFALAIARPLGAAYTSCGEAVLRSSRRMIVTSALVLAFAQVATVSINTAVLMATANFRLADVAGANFFLSGFTIFVAALGIAALARCEFRQVWPGLLALSVLILSASIMTSHAASRVENRLPLALATALHQGATASWIGGLPYLLMALRQSFPASAIQMISTRFSRIALISVAILASAGIGMSLFYFDSLNAISGTAYGVMVTSKVLLFGGLLLLGGLNFYTVRRLRSDATTPTGRLRCFVEAEIGIGTAIILAAATLTSVPPAVDLTVGRVSAAEIRERMRPRWPRLNSPGAAELSPPTLPAQKKAIASGVPLSYIPGGAAAFPSTPADIAWSEYNHHWSGLIVLAIGLMALAWRTGYASWARHWPLLFLALAVFLFVRSDPENWPLGENGFFESFGASEVAQHRLFVVLIIAFGFFEWAVRTGRITSSRAALFFPLVSGMGGAILLTHTHSLGNVKEELLIELTHIPIALLGITAGWARWLELRLPPSDRKIPSWIWPVCFVLVGLSLLLYREG
jgi:putative copper resistance protein D